MNAKIKYEKMIALHSRAEQQFLDSLTEGEYNQLTKNARSIDQLEIITVNKVKYTLITDVSWERFKRLDEFMLIAATGRSWGELYEKQVQLNNALQEGGRNVDAAVLSNDLVVSVGKNFSQRTDARMQIFACLAIREDEDPSEFNEAIHIEKLHAFEKSNISRRSIFTLVVELVFKSLTSYSGDFPTFSGE